MNQKTIHRFVVDSRPEYIGYLRDYICSLIKESGLEHAYILRAKCVVSEAVDNAIFHAHHLDVNKKVEVIFKLDEGRLVIEVGDEGEGFNMPVDIKEPPPYSTCRRGLFIIKAMSSEMSYTKGKDGRNWLRVVIA